MSLLFRHDPRAHYKATEAGCGQGNESKHSCRPLEADPGIQLSKHNGIYDSAEGTARCCNSVRKCFVGCKVLWEDRHTGDEQEAVAQTNQEGLSKHRLPKGLTQGCHHETERNHESAEGYQVAKVASIEGRATENSDHQEKECLDGSDPGNIRGRGSP